MLDGSTKDDSPKNHRGKGENVSNPPKKRSEFHENGERAPCTASKAPMSHFPSCNDLAGGLKERLVAAKDNNRLFTKNTALCKTAR